MIGPSRNLYDLRRRRESVLFYSKRSKDRAQQSFIREVNPAVADGRRGQLHLRAALRRDVDVVIASIDGVVILRLPGVARAVASLFPFGPRHS